MSEENATALIFRVVINEDVDLDDRFIMTTELEVNRDITLPMGSTIRTNKREKVIKELTRMVNKHLVDYFNDE